MFLMNTTTKALLPGSRRDMHHPLLAIYFEICAWPQSKNNNNNNNNNNNDGWMFCKKINNENNKLAAGKWNNRLVNECFTLLHTKHQIREQQTHVRIILHKYMATIYHTNSTTFLLRIHFHIFLQRQGKSRVYTDLGRYGFCYYFA